MMNDIKKYCQKARQDIVSMAETAGSKGMHFGGALSLIEIIAVLYLEVMKVNKEYFASDNRDRVIISKGHGVPAVYAVLHIAGIIDDSELKQFKQKDSILTAHPSINMSIGMEMSTGSLGQGLSQGVGIGIALKHKQMKKPRVFVIMGDGECDEGSIWEAAMCATKYKLNNVIAIVDRNQLQYDGMTSDVMPLDGFEDKWRSFGWNVVSIDGHDTDECYEAFDSRYDKPTVIIANTIKGKGISFMENNYQWHNGQMSKSEILRAKEELGIYDNL